MALAGGSYCPSYPSSSSIRSLSELIRDNNRQRLNRLNSSCVHSTVFSEKDLQGNTPLHLAAATSEWWRRLVFSWLTEHAYIDKSDVVKIVNTKNHEGNTPAHLLFAVPKLDMDFAIHLLQYVNINIQNAKGETPLHVLLRHKDCNADFVKQIFSLCKVKITQQDNEGNTYLHLAAQHEDNELAHVFLAKGATNNTINKSGQHPLDIAKAKGGNAFVALWESVFRLSPYLHVPGFKVLLPLALVLSKNPRRNDNDKTEVNFAELPDIPKERIADYVVGHSFGGFLLRAMLKDFNARSLNQDVPLDTQGGNRTGLVYRSLVDRSKYRDEKDEPCSSNSHERSEKKAEDRKGKKPSAMP